MTKISFNVKVSLLEYNKLRTPVSIWDLERGAQPCDAPLENTMEKEEGVHLNLGSDDFKPNTVICVKGKCPLSATGKMCSLWDHS